MNELKYSSIIYQMSTTAWAIMPEKLAEITALVLRRSSGEKLSTEELATYQAARQTPLQTVGSGGKSVAILSLVGTVIPRGNMFAESSGAVSCQRFSRSLREALADDDIGHIVIDIDSPGGSVNGVPELAKELYNARQQKPITAVSNGLCASAAYWLGTAAGELVVTPSGEVGSIGVYTAHQDFSKYLEEKGIDVTLISAGEHKVEGNRFEPLGEDALEYIQGQIDKYYQMFVGAVAQHRGVTSEHVLGNYGQGRVLMANDALEAGMVDRVATMDQVVSEIVQKLSDLDLRERRKRTRNR